MAWDELEDDVHAPTVIRLKCARIRFNSDSAIFMPEGLPVIAAAYKVAKEKPDLRLLIASHTDTVDTSEHNEDLSQARAKGVLHLVRGETREFAEHCKRANKSLSRDVRQVLKWANQVWGWPCDPGKVENTPAPGEAVKAFKEAYGKKFIKDYGKPRGTPPVDPPAETVDVDPGFWNRVVRLYGNTLRYDLLRVAKAADFKAMVEAIKWVDDAQRSIGCGERYLLVKTKDEVDKEANRRTEFLFVRPGEEPAKTDLEAVYKGGYAFEEMDCPPPEFFREPLPEGNIIFVIDCSGSMAARNVDGAPVDRIGEARRNLARAILDLDGKTSFTVIAYSGSYPPTDGSNPAAADPVLLWRMGGATSKTPLLKPATAANKAEAAAWVNARVASGGTMTGFAMQAAFTATGLLPDVTTTLVLLSDGAPTPRARGGTDVAERQLIVDEVRSANESKKWTIRTIGMLTKVDETGPLIDFLKALVANDGNFTPVAAIGLVAGS